MTAIGSVLVALAALAVGFTLGWLVREQRILLGDTTRSPDRSNSEPAQAWPPEGARPLAMGDAFRESAGAETIAETILETVRSIVPAEGILLTVRNEHGGTLTCYRESPLESGRPLLPGEEIDLPPTDTLSGWVLASRVAIWVPDCRDASSLPKAIDHTSIRHGSFMAVPLEINGEVHGSLEASHNETNAFTSTHFALLRLIGEQASAALHLHRVRREEQTERERQEELHASQIEELNRRRSLTDALLEMTSELTNRVDLDRLYGQTCSLVADVIQADCGYLLVRDHGPDAPLQVRSAVDRRSRHLDLDSASDVPGPLLELSRDVIRSQEGAWISDILGPASSEETEVHEATRSALAVPLVLGEEAMGSLAFSSADRSAFSEDHLRMAAAAAQQLSSAMYNAELYKLIRDQATNLGSMLREKQIETGTSHAVLESIADGVVATDAQDLVVVFNRSAERILGLHSSSVVGKPVFEITGAYGGAAQRLRDAIAGWRDLVGHPDLEGDHLEERITLEDNRVVSLHLAPVSVRDEFLGTVSIFRDVTREVEVDRLKSEFVATVSHELRTPMTSIKGYVEMILMGAVGDLNAEQRRFLQVIRSNIERLGDLVNDLLDISRIESGRVSLELIDFDLHGLLREVRDTFERRTRLDDKPMEIVLELPETLAPVRADPARIRQVLSNLIGNSFNYTPPGGQITITAWEQDGEARIQVMDNGMGIPPQEHAKVFERFYRGEGALELSISGTGLGLPIVRELVEMHQGRIWLESDGVPGDGSKFTFSLPLASRQLEPA